MINILLTLFIIFNSSLENKTTRVLNKHYKSEVILVDTGREDLRGKLYDVSNTNDKVFIGVANSMHYTFDYMLLFNSEKEIQLVKVLVYRENYGGEISSKRWLKQFIGLNKPKPFVDAISGATISVHNMHKAINTLLRDL